MDVNWELIQTILGLLALIMIVVFLVSIAIGNWLMLFVSLILMYTFGAGSMYAAGKEAES